MGACSISSLRIKDFLYLPGSCDDPRKYIYKNNLITNCVINRLMSILFSFQSRNVIKLNKIKH